MIKVSWCESSSEGDSKWLLGSSGMDIVGVKGTADVNQRYSYDAATVAKLKLGVQ